MDIKIISKAEAVRRMRLHQAALAEMIIADVVAGKPPASIPAARDRYCPQIRMAESPLFDTRKNWSGDIRDAALWTLMLNGFARGGAVSVHGPDEALSWRTQDAQDLRKAADIEMVFGGNRARMERILASLNEVECFGTGGRAVYVYTDTVLDRSGLHFCKIGRHHYSEIGMVVARVIQQYGAGNPGQPVLRYVFRTDFDVKLETGLHRHFALSRGTGEGNEWFEIRYADVLPIALNLLGVAEPGVIQR